jgi:hypothetical protein
MRRPLNRSRGALTETPLADLVAEGRRVVEACERAGVPARLLGGVAVAVRAGGHLPAGLDRPFKDIDLVVGRGRGHDAQAALVAAGYEPNTRFNNLHASSRLLMYDTINQRQLDVFIHEFRMCHQLTLSDRLTTDDLTLPLADLLLTKLQIVELNAKDRNDAYALLLTADLGDGDGLTISRRRLAEVCGSDWGWWRTLHLNLVRLENGLHEVELSAEARSCIASRVAAIREELEAAPKSRSWKLRARIGERKRWYEEPEEIEGPELAASPV